MDNNSNNKKINTIDIIGILRRNIFFIITVIIVSILLATGFSVYQSMNRPVNYIYKASAKTIVLNALDMEKQNEAALNFYMSNKIKNETLSELKLEGQNYQVNARLHNVPNEIIVEVTGPNKIDVVRVVDKVVAKSGVLIAGAMDVEYYKIIEWGGLGPEVMETSGSVSYARNIVVGSVIGFVLAVMAVFLFASLGNNIKDEDSLEEILNTKVLATIPNYSSEKKYTKIFKVR